MSVLALSKIGLKRKHGGILDDPGRAGASAGESGVNTGFIMNLSCLTVIGFVMAKC